WRATALTWSQKDLTCQRCLALGTAVQPPCFANTCERCSWTGRFVGLFPESTHHRENASVELRSISPRLSLLDFSRHIQTGNSVIRGSNFDANLYPKWVNFRCNSTGHAECAMVDRFLAALHGDDGRRHQQVRQFPYGALAACE